MKSSYCNTITALMFSAIVLALTVDARPATGGGRDATPQQDPWEKYRIILDRNIFSRQRGPVRKAGDGREPNDVVVPNPESHFVLKGIVQQDNEFIAFVEDTQAGTVLRLRQDGRVARGVLKALDLDGIEYQLEDRTTTIKLGYDLEGRLGPVTTSAAPQLPASSSAAAAPQPARRPQTSQPQTSPPQASQPQPNPPQAGQPQTPAGDEAEILKRLMEQRKQELGQQ